jgi:hypothetical protein
MKNPKVTQRVRHSEKLWLPSLLLLLGQFLTITPALLIVFADEQQRKTSDGYVTLLDGLERLSFAIAELENSPLPQDGVNQDSPAAAAEAWQQRYSAYRGELDHTLRSSARKFARLWRKWIPLSSGWQRPNLTWRIRTTQGRPRSRHKPRSSPPPVRNPRLRTNSCRTSAI